MNRVFTLSELPKITPVLMNIITENHSVAHATVVCLRGDLGSGKTTLTQSLAQLLGVTSSIQSPTFTILKNYTLPDSDIVPWKHLIHIDAYRLQGESELLRLNWDNYYHNPNNLIIIEWSELVPTLIPDNAIHVQLTHINETTRSIETTIHL